MKNLNEINFSSSLKTNLEKKRIEKVITIWAQNVPSIVKVGSFSAL